VGAENADTFYHELSAEVLKTLLSNFTGKEILNITLPNRTYKVCLYIKGQGSCESADHHDFKIKYYFKSTSTSDFKFRLTPDAVTGKSRIFLRMTTAAESCPNHYVEFLRDASRWNRCGSNVKYGVDSRLPALKYVGMAFANRTVIRPRFCVYAFEFVGGKNVKGRQNITEIPDMVNNLKADQLKVVYEDWGQGLGELHAKGLLHNDLHNQQVFFEELSNGTIRGRIMDLKFMGHYIEGAEPVDWSWIHPEVSSWCKERCHVKPWKSDLTYLFNILFNHVKALPNTGDTFEHIADRVWQRYCQQGTFFSCQRERTKESNDGDRELTHHEP
jgi:hypothetical protein